MISQKKKYLIYVGILILIVSAIFTTKFVKQNAKNHYYEFNSSKLAGRIEHINWQRGVEIKLFGDSCKYIFYPRIDPNLNNKTEFRLAASIGDSIFKEPFSDTLKLIKQEQVLFYTFMKFK